MDSQQAIPLPGNAPILDGWLTKPEVATQLGISTDTLSRLEARREGPPSVKIGRKTLYRTEAVRQWLTDREAAHLRAAAKRGAK